MRPKVLSPKNSLKYSLATTGLISAMDGSIFMPTPTPSSSTQLDPLISHDSSSTPSFKLRTPDEIDYYCYYSILSILSNKLYNTYYEFKNAKKLWEVLKVELGVDDIGIEGFNSLSFIMFSMVIDKPTNDHLHEFQDFIRYIQSKANMFTEDYKVSN